MVHKNVEHKTQSADAYAVRDYSRLRGLKGIPDALIEAHLMLYEGYVRNINILNRRLSETRSGIPEWAEMTRRVGFEINGMRLHELYFENLAPRGAFLPRRVEALFGLNWESSAAWEKEFRAMGEMRGVGWVILYRDPVTRRLSNHWIGLHEQGHPAGFTPILVMDVWEHAYTGMPRSEYIDAFFDNLNWDVVEARLS